MKKILISIISIVLIYAVTFNVVIATEANLNESDNTINESGNTIEENDNTGNSNTNTSKEPSDEEDNQDDDAPPIKNEENKNNSETTNDNEETNNNRRPTENYNPNSSTSTNQNNQTQKSQNADLKSLEVDAEGLSPEFNKNVTEYYLVVGLEVENIKVNAKTDDINADVVVSGNTDLDEGENKIRITVKAEAGNTKTYIINVTRTDNEELVNANLKSLSINGFELYPTFKPNIYNYNVNINEIMTSLDIKAEAENEKAKLEIEGNSDLKEGDNVIKINVTAEDGETVRTYKINAYISASNVTVQEENKMPAYIAIAVLAVIILVLSIILIKKKK